MFRTAVAGAVISLLTFSVCFYNVNELLLFLLEPLHSANGDRPGFFLIRLTDIFFLHVRVAAFFTVLALFPLLPLFFFRRLTRTLPGEGRGVGVWRWFAWLSPVMFLAGALCYRLALDPVFLPDVAVSFGRSVNGLRDWLDFMMTRMFLSGAACQGLMLLVALAGVRQGAKRRE